MRRWKGAKARTAATTFGTALILAGLSTPARAQTDATPRQTVQEILGFLVTNRGVQTNDFDTDQAAAESTRATLTRALLASITTLPVSTSSSGFSYRFNPALGTVVRTSDTFGPFYTERALTAAAGQASLGFTFQYASFSSLDGNNLRSGEFVTVANQFTDEPEPFDVERLTLKMTTRTATFFGSLGVSDRIEVGALVPLIRLDVNGSRLNTYRGSTLLQARAAAQTAGLGDVAIRTKVRLTPDGPGSVSAGVEARLPTGRAEDLLGAGEMAFRFTGLASYESGRSGVYGNFAIGAGGVGRDVSYGGAAALAATAHVTVVGELLMRRVAGLQRITEVVAPHPRSRGVNTLRLMAAGGNQTTSFAVTGIKWNVSSTWLLHANVLLPLADRGLTTRVTPTMSLDYSFAR